MKKKNSLIFLLLFFLSKENASSGYTRLFCEVICPLVAASIALSQVVFLMTDSYSHSGSSHSSSVLEWIGDEMVNLADFQKKILSDALIRCHKSTDQVTLSEFFKFFPRSMGYLNLGSGVLIGYTIEEDQLRLEKSESDLEENQLSNYVEKKKKKFEQENGVSLNKKLSEKEEDGIRVNSKKSITIPCGFVEFLIFSGISGSGKTVLIKNFIKEFAQKKECDLSNALYYEITLTAISSKYRGEQVSKLKGIISEIEKKLKKGLFCLVYLPAVEALAHHLDERGTSFIDGESIEVINQLTRFFSQCKNDKTLKLVVLAESSQPNLIDHSFVSYFSHKINLKNPEKQERLDFVKLIAEGKLYEEETNKIAEKMVTPRDMFQLVKAIEERKKKFCQDNQSLTFEELKFRRKEFDTEIMNHIKNTQPTPTGEKFLVKRS